MRVYIVLSGEDGEGGIVEGVFSERTDALSFASVLDPSDADWVRVEPWDVS